MMKKTGSILMIMLLVASLLVGCGNSNASTSSSSKKILMSLSSMKQEMVDAATAEVKALGYTLEVENADGSVSAQVESMKKAAEEGYSAIICLPISTDIVQELEIASNGVPIVFSNVMPDANLLEEGKYIYVGSNEEEAGKYQAEYVLKQLSDKDTINVALLMGKRNHTGTTGRTNAFERTMKASGKTVNYVFKDYCLFNADVTKSLFGLFLDTNQEFDCIISNSDTMAVAAIEICQEKNVDLSNVIVCGVDAKEEGLTAIKTGTMNFTAYLPLGDTGTLAIDAAARLSEGNTVTDLDGVTDDDRYIYIPFQQVDASNVTEYE